MNKEELLQKAKEEREKKLNQWKIDMIIKMLDDIDDKKESIKNREELIEKIIKRNSVAERGELI